MPIHFFFIFMIRSVHSAAIDLLNMHSNEMILRLYERYIARDKSYMRAEPTDSLFLFDLEKKMAAKNLWIFMAKELKCRT